MHRELRHDTMVESREPEVMWKKTTVVRFKAIWATEIRLKT
jgi:hypothetical protein